MTDYNSLTKEQLINLAENGDEEAQEYVAEGYAYGWYGFEERCDKLLKLADKGWRVAQDYVANGYRYGDYGFKQSAEKLMELAENGDEEAQEYVAKGYAYGLYGFEKSPKRLLELAEKGWKKAQELIVDAYVHRNTELDIQHSFEKLKEAAEKNWKDATYQLEGLANKGNKEAQALVVWATNFEKYGVRRKPWVMLEYSYKGWPHAREYVYEGYKFGWHGFEQSEEKLKEWLAKIKNSPPETEKTFFIVN